MILGNDTLSVKIRIGYVAFESVPLAVLCNLLFADDDFYVLADFKELVKSCLNPKRIFYSIELMVQMLLILSISDARSSHRLILRMSP